MLPLNRTFQHKIYFGPLQHIVSLKIMLKAIGKSEYFYLPKSKQYICEGVAPFLHTRKDKSQSLEKSILYELARALKEST